MRVSECKDIFALLSQYLDHELSEDICREIDAHIAGCPPCVEFLESLKKSIELCRRWKSEDEPGPLPEPARRQLYEAYQRALAARGKQDARGRRDRSH